MASRLLLFLGTNLAIILTLSLLGSLFGLDHVMMDRGMDWTAIVVVSALFGFGSSAISLLLSRFIAKHMVGVTLISSQKKGNLQWLAVMVEDLSRRAGLEVMPEIGVYRSDDVNAFATGPTRNRALVAFSSSLLQSMDKKAIEGVAAHEIGHIQNGDMVTMTLIQGVVNTLVLILARVVALLVSGAVRGQAQQKLYFLAFLLTEIVLGLLGTLITSGFSRSREYRADAAAAQLAGSEKMVTALNYLQEAAKVRTSGALPASLSALGISSRGKFWNLLSTHPSIEDRIKRLRQGPVN